MYIKSPDSKLFIEEPGQPPQEITSHFRHEISDPAELPELVNTGGFSMSFDVVPTHEALFDLFAEPEAAGIMKIRRPPGRFGERITVEYSGTELDKTDLLDAIEFNAKFKNISVTEVIKPYGLLGVVIRWVYGIYARLKRGNYDR
jgi:hypothetical protein